MLKKSLLLSFLLGNILLSNAQIGYQVALLNSATGEPRANESVSCLVELSNCEGTVFLTESKTATTNDFGILSLTVGNDSTFRSVNYGKLPFYVSATVDGILIGRTQILSVPLAEALRPVDLVGTWYGGSDVGSNRTLILDDAYNCTIINDYGYTTHGTYFVQGNLLCLCIYEDDGIFSELMMYNQGYLYSTSSNYTYSFRLSKN